MSRTRCLSWRAPTGGNTVLPPRGSRFRPKRRKRPSLALLAAELSLGFQPIVERRSAVSSARLVDLVGKPRDFLLGDLDWRWYRRIVAGATRPLDANGRCFLRVLWCSWHSSPLTSFPGPPSSPTRMFLGEVDSDVFVCSRTRRRIGPSVSRARISAGNTSARAPRCVTWMSSYYFTCNRRA